MALYLLQHKGVGVGNSTLVSFNILYSQTISKVVAYNLIFDFRDGLGDHVLFLSLLINERIPKKDTNLIVERLVTKSLV